MSELSGQVALVTGAGSGLGQGIALELARAGAAVAIVDRDERAARETLAMVNDVERVPITRTWLT